ncbi:MAG: helix-turn-helix domain-containing protein [Bacteroidales bacterium]
MINENMILKAICEVYKIESVHSDTREYAEPRQLAMWLFRNKLKWTLQTIATYFDRDHSTVIYSCNCIDAYIKFDHVFKKKYERIMLMLHPNFNHDIISDIEL